MISDKVTHLDQVSLNNLKLRVLCLIEKRSPYTTNYQTVHAVFVSEAKDDDEELPDLPLIARTLAELQEANLLDSKKSESIQIIHASGRSPSLVYALTDVGSAFLERRTRKMN